MRVLGIGVLLALAGCTTVNSGSGEAMPKGARYVAMGSSYAAGAGIGDLVPGAPKRCGRTVNNYAHLLAKRMELQLEDVSCGGATTSHILGPWSELPPQIDAVTSDARLVTVTIGGNDVNFVRNLIAGMCAVGSRDRPPPRGCPSAQPPAEADWAALEERMRNIAREVARRAPKARLVFVDYLKIIPDDHSCAALPLPPEDLAKSRETFHRLAKLTAKVAHEEGALLLPAGKLSEGHEACAPEPWTAGFPAKAAPWHPTAAGHAAVADALARLLSSR